MKINDLVYKRSEDKFYKYNLLELITLITAKPDIFGCSNFMMFAAFIEGYVFSKEAYSIELKEFNKWLSLELGFSQNLAWFDGLLNTYTNEDAINKLRQLFQEFKEKHPD